MSGTRKSLATNNQVVAFTKFKEFSGYTAGMEQNFDDSESEDAASRSGARESIFFGASLHFESTDQTLSVRVRNISAGGMMVDCTIGGVIGDRVIADIKNIGKVKGRIAWAVPPRMGIAFDHQIDASLARVKV